MCCNTYLGKMFGGGLKQQMTSIPGTAMELTFLKGGILSMHINKPRQWFVENPLALILPKIQLQLLHTCNELAFNK